MAIEAAPIIVKPSGDFLGNDGKWSAFNIDVGVPPQTVQVLPSTEASETLLVLSGGCSDKPDPSNCTELRGGMYNNAKSSQWVLKNNYTLNLETNLGMTSESDSGQFGYDQMSIRTEEGGNVTLDQQVLAAVLTKDFFVGSLGLSQLPINFTQPFDSRPSFISNLKNQSLIPSSSYGFTAGASYRNNATASLTLGGYDSSRFIPNDVSFGLGTNLARQLVVGLEKISYSDSHDTDKALLTEGILTLVDSTVPTIWLPIAACHAFEQALGIVYDPVHNLYLVNDTVHDHMVKQNASVTFQLANTLGSTSSVNITLPYSSFDLEIGYPLLNQLTKYFPLRRAADETQYTLGRTFMQEAYLIVDYENKNFSISQTSFTDAPAHIVAIQPNNGTGSASTPGAGGAGGGVGSGTITKTTNHSSSKSFPVGAIAGIVVAVILVAFVSGFFTARWYKKKSRSAKRKQVDEREELEINFAYPRDKVEVEDTGPHSSDDGTGDKKHTKVSVNPVSADSPGIEIGSSDSYLSHYPGNYHGMPMELPGSPPPRSEAASPEPQYSRAEMSTPEPPSELWSDGARSLNEMPSTDQRPTLIDTHSPSPELPSALQSPVFPRPKAGSRRSAQYRLSTASSERPTHDRQGSNDSISAYAPTNPSHLRNDLNDASVRPAITRKESNDSGLTQDTALVSPIQRPEHRRSNSEDTIETRLEGLSSTALFGSTQPSRSRSGRRQNSGPPSALTSPQLGSMSEEAMIEEPNEVVDLKK
ncbi:MAG: hypothetical protein Q9191_007197 [Dirinaria sp. TL-2023a]